MRSFRSLLFVLSMVVLLSSVANAQVGNESPKPKAYQPLAERNVILIGWDGAQRSRLKECLERGELPNLDKLRSKGALVAIDVLRTTDTSSGWSQILTGYEPEVTGVFSNSRYKPIPKGYTVFERLKKFFGPDSIVTAAIICKKAHLDFDPPSRELIDEKSVRQTSDSKSRAGDSIIVENGVKYRYIPGQPYFYTRESVDAFINGLMEDEKVVAKTLELLERYKDKRFFFFVHFAEVDRNGHDHGEDSKEYREALDSADARTGKIVRKLLELNLYDKTLIYITADHGFDRGMKNHADAPYIFLATNDPKVIRRGTRADIAPTILDRFGLDLSQIEPPLDGHPLTKPYEAPIW